MISLTATELPRFLSCNGSRSLQKVQPFETDDTLAREGDAVHWLVEQVFRGLFTIEELVDRKAPNGMFITSEMVEHVADYLATIGRSGLVEVDTSHSGALWEVRGRADHIDLQAEVLYVDDFKYGWKIVDPEMNWTLISHAIGFMRKHPEFIVSRIVFRVFQPRPFHPQGPNRSWSISFSQLHELLCKIDGVLNAPSDTLNTGSHCYKCPSLSVCPAAQRASMLAVEVSEQAFNSQMSNETLSLVTAQADRAIKMLEQFKDACEDLIKSKLKAGQMVPGLELQNSYGHKAWKEGITPEITLLLTGRDLSKKSLVTPAQAKKLGVPDDVVDSLCEKPMTGVKLVRIDESKRGEQLFGKKGE